MPMPVHDPPQPHPGRRAGAVAVLRVLHAGRLRAPSPDPGGAGPARPRPPVSRRVAARRVWRKLLPAHKSPTCIRNRSMATPPAQRECRTPDHSCCRVLCFWRRFPAAGQQRAASANLKWKSSCAPRVRAQATRNYTIINLTDCCAEQFRDFLTGSAYVPFAHADWPNRAQRLMWQTSPARL